MNSILPIRRNGLTPRHDVFDMLSGELDRMLNHTFGNNFLTNGNGKKDTGFPRFDAYEADNNLFLEFHVSGIPSENLTVEESDDSQNRIVTVSGKSESRREDAQYHIKELRKSSFSRSVRLPTNARGQPDATLNDGVLTLVYQLENQEPEQATRKIEVKTK